MELTVEEDQVSMLRTLNGGNKGAATHPSARFLVYDIEFNYRANCLMMMDGLAPLK